MTKVIMNNMCMIENLDGQVLVQERIKSWKGVAFPGGKIENNESIYNSTIREIKEETGLDIDKLRFCGVKDWYDAEVDEKYVIFLFKTNTYSGKLLDGTYEGKNYWVDKKSLTSLNLSSGFEKDLELFLDDGKFEISFVFDDENGWVRDIV